MKEVLRNVWQEKIYLKSSVLIFKSFHLSQLNQDLFHLDQDQLFQLDQDLFSQDLIQDQPYQLDQDLLSHKDQPSHLDQNQLNLLNLLNLFQKSLKFQNLNLKFRLLF